MARFLGFDGSFERDGETVVTRPAHVVLDPAGPLAGRVTRVIPVEDGARLEISR